MSSDPRRVAIPPAAAERVRVLIETRRATEAEFNAADRALHAFLEGMCLVMGESIANLRGADADARELLFELEAEPEPEP